MATTKPRVVIPRKPEDLLKLAQAIQAKSAELGDDSPLKMLDWPTKAATVQEALDAHRRAEEMRLQIEIAYEQRDRLLKDITTWVRQSRDVLTGLYREEMRKLGEYGFTVDSSSSRPKPSAAPAPPAEPTRDTSNPQEVSPQPE